MDSLFGFENIEDGAEQTRQERSHRNGSGAQHLVLADLTFRGYDCDNFNGLDTDVFMLFEGSFRRLQVKSSVHSKYGRNSRPAQRIGLLQYIGKVDAFAFVNPMARAVYYVYSGAINAPDFTVHAWGRQHCNLSFSELLKRWQNEQARL